MNTAINSFEHPQNKANNYQETHHKASSKYYESSNYKAPQPREITINLQELTPPDLQHPSSNPPLSTSKSRNPTFKPLQSFTEIPSRHTKSQSHIPSLSSNISNISTSTISRPTLSKSRLSSLANLNISLVSLTKRLQRIQPVSLSEHRLLSQCLSLCNSLAQQNDDNWWTYEKVWFGALGVKLE